MKHIYCCSCGVQTPCEAKDISLGSVFQCPACQKITAHVYPKCGGRGWITVDPKEAAFYDLLGRQGED